jgi:TonB family protein
MKVIKLLAFLLMLFPILGEAQELPTIDTTIFKVAEEMPRFPGCERLDTTLAAKTECAQASLMSFMYSNIRYPLEARQNGNEGMVVLSFVVEKDGFISNPTIIKDIGGGCGEEALRVAQGMNSAMADAGLRWIPAKRNGKPIRMQYNLPVRFKLEAPPEYVMVGIDTVYVEMDDSLSFKGGEEALSTYVKSKLKYPSNYRDSCFIGAMDMKVLVDPEGIVKVLDVSDYFDLGFDFQFEAIQTATSTFGQWNPATLRGRNVPTSYDFLVEFIPEKSKCPQAISDYEKAQILADEGLALFNEGNQEGGIEKLSAAIELFPKNANYRYIRGQAYMALEKMEEACEDLTMVKNVLSIGLVNNLLPIICNQ